MSKRQVTAGPYSGPLDLLLYLVRKHELDVVSVPIAPLAADFAAALLAERILDLPEAADFLEVVGQLVELKAERVLPHADAGMDSEELELPTADLVRRLLEFKQYRELAAELDLRRQAWRARYTRAGAAALPRLRSPDVSELELWDLVAAYARLTQVGAGAGVEEVVWDDTPLERHMEELKTQLLGRGKSRFSEWLSAAAGAGEPQNRSRWVGIFLAVLELMRQGELQVEQAEPFGEIWLQREAKG